MSASAWRDPRAWKVATALGLECGLGWATTAARRRAEDCTCVSRGYACVHVGLSDRPCDDHEASCRWGRLVPAPWDVDAPGPPPSLEYCAAELVGRRLVPAAGLWWKVSDHVTVTIGHGAQTLWDVLWSGEHATLRPRFRSADIRIASDGLRLADAAAKAMMP